jgi:deazaflavin-dependent oxidoreductase (nitroreductase family)
MKEGASRGEPLFLYLTTTGRLTGQPREIEIWFTQYRGRFYIIAEHGTRAQWVQNVMAHPSISFQVGKSRFAGHGRVIDAEKESHLNHTIQQLSEKKYGWGDGLVVELIPNRSPSKPLI